MAKKSTVKTFGPGFTDKVKKVAIGIDQSYSGFGVTFMDVESGAYRTVVFKGDGIGVDRLVDISEKLGTLIDAHVPARATDVVVAMEGYAFGSQMANMAGELGAAVKLQLRDLFHKYHGRYPYIIPPTVLKKYVTGKGTGVQKNQILLHVFKKWGVEFNDDNAADSYALAHLVAGKGALTYEREIYHNIQDPKYREK
jgi:crossover junction endodeoxyribonuclease RuvC